MEKKPPPQKNEEEDERILVLLHQQKFRVHALVILEQLGREVTVQYQVQRA